MNRHIVRDAGELRRLLPDWYGNDFSFDVERPLGFCQCGCGERTSLSTRTDRRAGLVKGQPRRFIRNHHLRKNVHELFWSQVSFGVECWEWVGATFSDGRYGQAYDPRTQKNVLAHRLAYELQFGESPGDLFVCHHCDNTLCVRGDHLFLGTAKDNAEDMVSKGRSVSGTRNRDNQFGEGRGRVLTREDVVALKARVRSGAQQKDVAAEYGISKGLVSLIMNGSTWADVP